jgi:hypothetical protein
MRVNTLQYKNISDLPVEISDLGSKTQLLSAYEA